MFDLQDATAARRGANSSTPGEDRYADDMSRAHNPQLSLRLVLLRNGYFPVPVAGKAPHLPNWREAAARADKAECERWEKRFTYDDNGKQKTYRGDLHTNTGILCDSLACPDIDVLDPDLAQRIEEAAEEILGITPLHRVGKAPKVLLVYRSTTPVRKLKTAELLLPDRAAGKDTVEVKPDGSTDGVGAHVEILGCGQQFVAYGIHPETRNEYMWTRSGPDVVPFAELPVVTEKILADFLAEAERILRQAGGRTEKEWKAPIAGNKPTPEEVAHNYNGHGPTAAADDFFGAVNTAALAALGVWVPKLFPRAKYQSGTGAYRVTSADLGRKYEEDLSLHPEGIQDFGPRTGMTPIDVLMTFAGAPKPQDAALQLCEWLRLEPSTLGWKATKSKRGRPKSEAKREAEPAAYDISWPEPIDILTTQVTGAPELLPEHIPEAIGDFVFDTAFRLSVDPASVAMSSLGVMSAVVTDDWSIHPKKHDYTWTERARIWVVLVGGPSLKKSPLFTAIIKALDALEAEERTRHEEAKRQYDLDLEAWEKSKDDAGTKPEYPRQVRYKVGNATTEALSEILRDDADAKFITPAKKLLVLQDELAGWVASFDRYRSGGRGGQDRALYLEMYNGGSQQVDRVGRGSVFVKNWSACVVGGIQPEPIRRIAKDTDDDGLLQRFLYCVPDADGADVDVAPNANALRRYEAIFPALVHLQPDPDHNSLDGKPRKVRLSEEAYEILRKLRLLFNALGHAPDTSKVMKTALAKWAGTSARLTLLFHLIEAADRIARGVDPGDLYLVAGETAQRVSGFMRDILLPHLVRADEVMFSTQQQHHAKWIAGHILAHGLETVAARDVMRAYGAFRSPESRRELESVMASLETVGWLRAMPETNPAKPPTSWWVNPNVHRLFVERARVEKERRQQAQRDMADLIARAKRGEL